MQELFLKGTYIRNLGPFYHVNVMSVSTQVDKEEEALLEILYMKTRMFQHITCMDACIMHDTCMIHA